MSDLSAEIDSLKSQIAALEEQKTLKTAQLQDKQKAAVALLDPVMVKLQSSFTGLRSLKHSDIHIPSSSKAGCDSGASSLAQQCPSALLPTMSALMMMFDVNPAIVKDPNSPGKSKRDYWAAAKREFEDKGFLNRLVEFDKDNQDEDVVGAVEKFIANANSETGGKAFEVESVRRCSIVGGVFCEWVLAMLEYHRVSKVLNPIREELQKGNDELNAVCKELEKLCEKLAALEKS